MIVVGILGRPQDLTELPQPGGLHLCAAGSLCWKGQCSQQFELPREDLPGAAFRGRAGEYLEQDRSNGRRGAACGQLDGLGKFMGLHRGALQRRQQIAALEVQFGYDSGVAISSFGGSQVLGINRYSASGRVR